MVVGNRDVGSATWRSLAIPTEHGGWSFTLEPVLLALIVAPSAAGATLGLAALIGFMSRTPLKLSLVDRLRGRRLPRTGMADRLVAAYGVVLVILVALAAWLAEAPFWWPVAVAAPLIAIELWFDARSRGRHLTAELVGTIGIGGVGAAIVLAGGGSGSEAIGVWLVVAARAIAAVVFVRVQVRRLRDQEHRRQDSDTAQAVAVAVAAVGTALSFVPAVATAAIVLVGLLHGWLVRRPVPRVGVVGAQQIVIGLSLVLVAGLGFAAPG